MRQDYKNRNVELQCPHSNLEVLRKPVNTMNIGIAAHANSVENYYAIFVFTYEISQVSKLQDKHNAFL